MKKVLILGSTGSIGTQALTATVKRFGSFIGVAIGLEYAAGIGLVYSEANEAGGYHRSLEYARVGGVTYGSPVVSSEAGRPPRASATLDVWPNPTAGPATASFMPASWHDVSLDVFSTLGHHLHRSHHASSSGSVSVPLDTSGWPSGVYVVRATAGDVSVSHLLVRR